MDIIQILNSPEFWLSVAFTGVVLLSIRPMKRYLKTWGDKRAQMIQGQIDDAVALKTQAQALLAEYQEKTKNKHNERKQILKKAQLEADTLATDINRKLTERLNKQDEDMSFRLTLLKTHGEKEIYQKVLSALLKQTHKNLHDQKHGSHFKQHFDNVLDVLDEQLENIQN